MDCSEMAQEVSRHINSNALKYYPSLDRADPEVRLISEQHRSSSSLYRFEVVNHVVRHNVLAKGIDLANNPKRGEITGINSRPRLAPGPTDYRVKPWLEFTALKAIYEYFEKLSNASLGAIRVLDFIQNTQTIVMDEHRDPSLRSLFAKTNRLNHLRGRAPDLRRAFFNAGAWLKAYSTLPKVENVITRLPHREDFNESVIIFTGFLGRIFGDTSFFQRVEKIVIAAAEEFMPCHLPLSLGHGDYAMRNILVGENDRVTAFDTCAKWKVPIYEDIAYFLVQLETNGLQIISQGFAIHAKTVAAYQREFLAGYFGETHIPIEVIRLFQIQSLLDSWSSQVSINIRQHGGLKMLYQKLYLALLNRRYRTIMARLLDQITVRSS
jgi:hypothetical protein